MSPKREWAESMFRPAASRPVAHNCLRAFLQTAMMWGLFLFLLPWLIVTAQRSIGIPFFDSQPIGPLAIAGFALFGLTGCYCGLLFVLHGRGTPLPLDQTTQLVVLGPYRVVRNPMAILGIGQGVLVGLYLGSWPVVAYAVAGAFVWNFVARPLEEADMKRRYGQAYVDYAQSVPCWLPTRRPYPQTVGSTKADQTSDFPDKIETAGDQDHVGI